MAETWTYQQAIFGDSFEIAIPATANGTPTLIARTYTAEHARLIAAAPKMADWVGQAVASFRRSLAPCPIPPDICTCLMHEGERVLAEIGGEQG